MYALICNTPKQSLSKIDITYFFLTFQDVKFCISYQNLKSKKISIEFAMLADHFTIQSLYSKITYHTDIKTNIGFANAHFATKVH